MKCVSIEISDVFRGSGDNLVVGVVFISYSCEKPVVVFMTVTMAFDWGKKSQDNKEDGFDGVV